MKKAFALSLLLLLFLSGCTNAEKPAPEPKIQRSIEGVFSLDQTPEEFLEMLKKEGIELNAHPTPDGRTIERNGYFMYETNEVRVMFSPEERPTFFTVLSPRYATELGLRVGDSEEKMLDLYGHNYFQREGHPEQYGYTVDDLGMGFYIKDSLIFHWSIYIPSEMISSD